LRIIATTVLASTVVLLLGAWLILTQAKDGIMAGKEQISIAEASNALEQMQEQLRDTDFRDASLNERLRQITDEMGSADQAFQLIIDGSVSTYRTALVSDDSVPSVLKQAVENQDGLFATPTLVQYFSPGKESEPGLAIGGKLHTSDGLASFPTYFIFPYDQEAQTMQVLQQAVWTSTVALILALAVIAYLISRQVTRPIRAASLVASRIASGDFAQRMQVRGTDDLARLSVSMNDMAADLASQIERLELLSKVQQQFVSDVSHELRTPLTTMKMAGELLFENRDEFDAPTQRTVELLSREINRFESMLTDLLEISRFDAGAAKLNLELADVAELTRAETAELRGLANRMGTQLRLSVDSEEFAEIDTRRIRRILRNLLSNAIEYSDGKPIDVKVVGGPDTVTVTVRDHGSGFTSEQSKLLFQRFWRADPSRTRTLGGTGLGLAISLEDAKLHNGYLEAAGLLGQGAIFRLTIPKNAGAEIPPPSGPLRLPRKDQ
jgi:two-component system sensor histidine kinase MtrB